MMISHGQFAGFFSRNIRCIDSTGQIHLYMDKVKHRGSYKHCREVFNRLTRAATA